jgi:hypothetical protein
MAGDPDQKIYHIDTSGYVELTYTLDLGTATKTVYFIFSNAGAGAAGGYPGIVTFNQFTQQDIQVSSQSPETSGLSLPGEPEEQPDIRVDIPEISEFNRRIPARLASAEGPIQPSIMTAPTLPLFDVLNETGTFQAYDASTDTVIPIDATCRYIVQDSTANRTLNVWVENTCWTSGQITAGMVQTMANKFLQQDATNDIYDWVSNIFGKEWGAHSYDNLIDQNTNNITILLYNIDGNTSASGILGFFWSKDNFKKSSIADSNERLMFYIDAGSYATKDDGTWEVTDYWPDLIISTLAHEFQHMIHYYQKNVLRGTSSETWLNEMCSMAAEDLVSSHLQTRGPRGVNYNDGTDGSPDNLYGRLPQYQYNNFSLTAWYSDSVNYAVTYGFGAYLARNFGHALLFRHIVQSTLGDEQAIEYALAETGHPGETFTSLLRKWGAANLLSHLTTLPTAAYYYNRGAFLDEPLDSVTYQLGSINLNNYTYAAGIYGSRLYTSVTYPAVGNQPGTSNLYYQAGINLTGAHTWTIRMENNIYLTVVVM